MLGNPFDEVGRRLSGRGGHGPVFPMNAAAADIAHSFRRAIYCDSKEGELFFGLSVTRFTDVIAANGLDWVAYCDEAFDDGSYVLQFEDQNQVRLVAFTSTPDGLYDPASLREVSLAQNDFYQILQEWHDRFEDEWAAMPRISGFIQ
jgi:hypothetical protein